MLKVRRILDSVLSCILLAATIASGSRLHADRIVIQKSARQLTLMRNGKPFRSYLVSLGSNPTGAKEREGDGRLPKASTQSIAATEAASTTWPFTCRIRMPPIVFALAASTYHRAARS